MRVQIPSDFEDITLYGPHEAQDKAWNQKRISSSDFGASFNAPLDPHFSVASTSSTISTPTLASDTSSLRSSMSSQSSPNISHASTQLPVVAPIAPILENKPTQSNFNRRRSVPTLIDTTSMASLTIKNQGAPRSRKQREVDFEADQDDDIWPSDSLMFNVPMSPALYAQQKMKHYQMNQRSSNRPTSTPSGGHKLPFNHHPEFNGLPPHSYLNHKKRSQSSGGLSSKLHHQYTPNPVSRLNSSSSSNLPKRSSGLRNDISFEADTSIEQVSPTHGRRTSCNDGIHYKEDEGVEFDDGDDESEYSHHNEMSYTKQPAYYTPGNTSNFDDSYIASNLSQLFLRNGSASGGNLSINGLDADASDLTLELFELQENRERTSHGLPHNIGDNSMHSISNLALADDSDVSLPPVPATNNLDSRRSSLTRPENLPPKDPKEEQKHLEQYEKLLREAAYAEKKKQQKRDEEAKKRAQQSKTDLDTWNRWLAKGCKSSLSSDLKWRGIPEKARPAIWKLKLSAQKSNQFSNKLPPFQMRHNSQCIQKEVEDDSEKIWPECAIFGRNRPLHEPLINTIQQFMNLRKEVPYSFELAGIAAVLILQLNESDAVHALLNLLEPGTLLHSILTQNERIFSANYVTFNKVFKSKFPQLSAHFAKVDMSTPELLNPLIGSLFTTILPRPEYVMRIVDVFIFEGDSFLLRAALGLIRINEAFFYGSKQEILEEMYHLRISSEDAMMREIRNITRK